MLAEELARLGGEPAAGPRAAPSHADHLVHDPQEVIDEQRAILDARHLDVRETTEQVAVDQRRDRLHHRPITETMGPLEGGLAVGVGRRVLSPAGGLPGVVAGVTDVDGADHFRLVHPGPERVEMGVRGRTAVDRTGAEVEGPTAMIQRPLQLGHCLVNIEQAEQRRAIEPTVRTEAPILRQPSVEGTIVGVQHGGIAPEAGFDTDPRAREQQRGADPLTVHEGQALLTIEPGRLGRPDDRVGLIEQPRLLDVAHHLA